MRGKQKGLEFFKLMQNFHTHDHVIRLGESVITLLHYYFPQSVDLVECGTGVTFGQTPVFLTSKPGDENVIITIFGNSESTKGKIKGFGAEQSILVRDESAKKEVYGIIGRKAIVLTIDECKGLEFQDVLLYNFFGSSPLKNQWRVVYEYMKERGLLDMPSPNLSEERQSVLCSELKQLYVAITRTRQRLWICERSGENSEPMFQYWRKLCLVETKEIDDSLAQAMQTPSTRDTWQSKGKKLLLEKNYDMAIFCFENSGEKMWEERAKAARLMAEAERIRHSDPEKACTCLREAAKKLYQPEMFELAAKCYYESRDYEQAGNIYLEKYREPRLRKAAECFTLAGCYEKAAEIYANGSYFSECLSVCIKGKCFDMALKYVKQLAAQGNLVGNETDETGKVKEFLENCASDYSMRNDRESMMKFVNAFPSMDMKRNFLKSVKCLNELLRVEEEFGDFTKAKDIQNFLSESEGLNSKRYFEKLFPLDSRKSMMGKKLVSLRRSEFSRDLLQEIIRQENTGRLSYAQTGRLVMIQLSSCKLSEDFNKAMIKKIPTGPWKSFMEILSSSAEECSSGPQELIQRFHNALQDKACLTVQKDPMSPGCFFYLVERFMILVAKSRCEGTFYTTRSSLMEWMTFEQYEVAPTSWKGDKRELGEYCDSIFEMVKNFIRDKPWTLKWISRSKINDQTAYYKLLVCRLVLIISLLVLNFEDKKVYSSKFMPMLMDDKNVKGQIPGGFLDTIFTSIKKGGALISDTFAKAFDIAGDPLYRVSMEGIDLAIDCRGTVIQVYLKTNGQREYAIAYASIDELQEKQIINWEVFQEISALLKHGTSANISVVAQWKMDVIGNIEFMDHARRLLGEKNDAGEDSQETLEDLNNMYQELETLHSLLDTSDLEIARIEELLKSLLSRKPKLEFLCIEWEDNNCTLKSVNALCSEIEKMELPSATTESGSSNQGAEKKEKGNSKKSKKGKGRRK